MATITIADPATKAELVRELRSVHEQSTAFWSALPTAVFFAPLGEAWSPAQNVRHLGTSIRAVTQGLAMPKLVLFGLFGIHLRPGLRYSEVRERYRGTLAAGGRASGRYLPAPSQETDDEARAGLMERREATAAALEKAIAGWSERALDRLVLPHPLLGRLSAREMLFFTLYHNAHHVENVARRLA